MKDHSILKLQISAIMPLPASAEWLMRMYDRICGNFEALPSK